METWRHGDMETWRHGDMETWIRIHSYLSMYEVWKLKKLRIYFDVF